MHKDHPDPMTRSSIVLSRYPRSSMPLENSSFRDRQLGIALVPPPVIAYRGPPRLGRRPRIGNLVCAGNLASVHGFAELFAIAAYCFGHEILELDVFQGTAIHAAPVHRKVPRLVVPKIVSRTRSRRGRRGWRHRSGARLGHRRERLGLQWLRRGRLGKLWLLCHLCCLDRCCVISCEGAAARYLTQCSLSPSS